jgi:serine/threonine protein phosphatase PrpC
MRVEFGCYSHVGKVREHNEDAYEYAHYTGGDALIVCDGMGGHAAGDVASGLARATLAAALIKDQYPDPRELIYRALEAAHEKVLSVASASDARAGMGTTAVVALIKAGALYLGHVGDSRAYLIREGTAQQLTRDQTRVQAMVDNGLLTEQGAKAHPDAGVLVQAIGQPRGLVPLVTPEREGIALRPEDILVLCTDGVYDALDPQDLVTLTERRTAEQAARALVETAVERDGQDNATAVVGILRAPLAEPASMGRGTPSSHAAGPVRRTVHDGSLDHPLSKDSREWVKAVLAVALLFSVALLAFAAGRYSAKAMGGAEAEPNSSGRPQGPAPADSGRATLDRAAASVPDRPFSPKPR